MKKKAQYLVGYLRSCISQLYYQMYAKNSEMDEETRFYMVVKAALRKEFDAEHDLQRSIKDSLSFKQHGKQSAYGFALKAKKYYEEAGFKVEQKLVFLS